MKNTYSVFVFILFFANSLYAQSVLQTSANETTLAPTKSSWGFKVDLSFMRFNGSYGFGITYDVMDKLSSELSYTHANYHIEDYAAGLRTFDTNANAYGLRLNYYPFSDVKRGGFYTSATVSSVSLITDISVKTLLLDTPINKDLEGQHIGRQVFMGYHFMNFKKDGIKLSSRLGAGYGNGNSYSIREGWKDYEIADTFLLDTSVILFY